MPRLRDLPALLRTPLGRFQLQYRVAEASSPLLWGAACLHRRTWGHTAAVVAVTGSFGKSTTTRALKAALGLPYQPWPVWSAGPLLAREVLRLRPGARAVLETGFDGPGKARGVGRMVQPDLTIVTAIGSEHLTSMKSLLVTRDEKAHMVRALRPGGSAILNGDDPHVAWMAGECREAVVTFGLEERNDVRATDIRLDWPRGTRMRLHVGGESFDLATRFVGRHMVYPFLGAAAAAHALGVAAEAFLPGLEALAPTVGRMQVIELPGGAYLIRDDYKAPREAIETALDTLAEIPARRRIVVLGELQEPEGSRAQRSREIGARVARSATHALFVGSRKSCRAYASGAAQAGMPRERMTHAPRTWDEVLEALPGDLGAGDVVLVKTPGVLRFERLSFALAGRTVRCRLTRCAAPYRCDTCPMLETGWEGHRHVHPGDETQA